MGHEQKENGQRCFSLQRSNAKYIHKMMQFNTGMFGVCGRHWLRQEARSLAMGIVQKYPSCKLRSMQKDICQLGLIFPWNGRWSITEGSVNGETFSKFYRSLIPIHQPFDRNISRSFVVMDNASMSATYRKWLTWSHLQEHYWGLYLLTAQTLTQLSQFSAKSKHSSRQITRCVKQLCNHPILTRIMDECLCHPKMDD